MDVVFQAVGNISRCHFAKTITTGAPNNQVEGIEESSIKEIDPAVSALVVDYRN